MKILNNATTEKSADFGVKKITDLKTATRDQNRVNVFVDHKFAFSLTIQQVAEMKVRINNEYTETELEEIQAASDFGKLLQRSLEYALSRPHSEKEIRDYLKRKKIKRELEQKRYDEFLARVKKIKKSGSAILRKIIASNLRSKQKLDCQQNRAQ